MPAWMKPCCCVRSAWKGRVISTWPASTRDNSAPIVSMMRCRAKLARTRAAKSGSFGVKFIRQVRRHSNEFVWRRCAYFCYRHELRRIRNVRMRLMTQSPQIANSPRFPCWKVLFGALVIPLIYLPTLGTRFDFIDDGNLVYPAPPMPLGPRLDLVKQKIVANYQPLGPFRPVLWAHWELFAELCNGEALRWRIVRLGWSMFATGMLLALMRELRLRAWPSMLAAALAMWNPYRNEIWTSLTLSEGVAMPYALAGLWCAARANRSGRAWPWDLASMLGVLAALGCKNTFAALVPAQLYLRMYADGATWREGVRRHGMRAAFLALTLALPVGHYAYFRLHWHPGQYPPTSVTAAQLGRMLSALGGAMSWDFMGVGFIATILVIACFAATRVCERSAPLADAGRGETGFWITVLLLVIFGVGVYLPMPAVSGRYTMPAVWGLDLAFAGLIGLLLAVRIAAWRRLALAGIVGGLVVVAAANVGRQQKFAARSALLWRTLEYGERECQPETWRGWMAG